MQIIIQKYLMPANENWSQNLFGLKCEFIDRITITKFLKASFPLFKSEYYYQDDIMHLKAGEFELELSVLGDDNSEIEHKNIYEFFNFGEPTETGREKYLVIALISQNKKYSGILDISTLKIKQRETIINFSTYGLEKELTDWLDKVKVDDLGLNNMERDWESEYLPFHFRNMKPTGIIGDVHVNIVSQLNINSRTGRQVIVKDEFQHQLMHDGLNRGYSAWQGLKSFMINWGFTAYLEFTGFSYYEPRFDFKLRWRSQSINDAGVIDEFIEYEKSMQVSDIRWIFIQSGQLVESIADIDYFVGVLFDKDNFYIREITPYPSFRIAYNTQNPVNKIFQVQMDVSGNIRNIPEDRVKIIKSHFHAKCWNDWFNQYLPTQNRFDVNIPYARIAAQKYTEGGITYRYGNLLTLGMSEYSYLFKGISARRNMVLYDEKDIVVGTKATINGKQFICERINSYSDFEKRIDCEWREI